MFCNTLVNNPELCKELAELIIGRKISILIKVQDQQAVKVTPDGTIPLTYPLGNHYIIN